MAGRGCNLECVKGKIDDNVREFVGPVKIILVDEPSNVYLSRRCYAAAIVLAQMMMSVVALTAMFYSMTYNKNYWLKALHIFLCTIGFQACIPSGILSLNNLNGSAMPMSIEDRQIEHILLESVGLICPLFGMLASFYPQFPTFFTIHTLLGITANCIFALCGFTGLLICKYCGNTINSEELELFDRCVYFTHRILGILGFLTATACFVSGVILLPFKKWLPLQEMFYITIVFCIFSTIIIIYKPLKGLI